MPKYLVFILLFATVAFRAAAQKVDSLRRLVVRMEHSLMDTARVNRINALSDAYFWPKPDSCLFFARMANSAARRLNYPKGIASSLQHIGMGEMREGKLKVAEGYVRQSEAMFIKNEDLHGAARAQMTLGVVLYWQGLYDQAIPVYERSLRNFRKCADSTGVGAIVGVMGNTYQEKGDHENAFKYFQIALPKRKAAKDHKSVFFTLLRIGDLFKTVGDFESAKGFYKECYQYASANLEGEWWRGNHDYYMGTLYIAMQDYDSAFQFLKRAQKIQPKDNQITVGLGEVYNGKKNYDSALIMLLPAYAELTTRNDKNQMMRALKAIVVADAGKQQDGVALKYAKDLYRFAVDNKSKKYIGEAASQLADLYTRKHAIDTALKYQKIHTSLISSFENSQYLFRMSRYRDKVEAGKKNSEIRLLTMTKEIQEQELRQKSLIQWALMAGLAGLLVIAGIVFGIVRLRRKNDRLSNERTQAELRQRAVELELLALRAQMNPHFIFNCLNSINRFILKNNTDVAADYLTRFSKLMRKVLELSKQNTITLQEELDSLELYTQLENLRFDHPFDYSVTISPGLDPDAILIPPLLLQPFIENAIWHGLMPKASDGKLTVALRLEGCYLMCSIEDNGAGTKKREDASGRESLGLKITSGRLALINEDPIPENSFKIQNMVDPQGEIAGTHVELRVRYFESTDAT